MKVNEIDALADAVAGAIKGAIDGPRVTGRIEQLETRIAALEQKPHLKFCGVHELGRTYQPGNAVTRSGSLWVCQAETSGKPGDDYYGWTLGVKRGRA